MTAATAKVITGFTTIDARIGVGDGAATTNY